MNLHSLRLFLAAAREGSVTRAAEALRISQPAVTTSIKRLEQELGITLLAQSGRGILLTEAGQSLAAQADRLFALEAEMERSVAAYKEGSLGKLRIAATYLPANFLLPRMLARYKREFEQVEVELTSTNSKHAFELLLGFQADLAFIGGGRQAPESIDSKIILEDDMLFVVHAGHALAGRASSLHALIHEPFVIREEGSSSREKLLACCSLLNAGAPRIGLQVNGLSETIRAVKEGYGITFVSALEVRDDIRRGDLAIVEVPDAHTRNPIAICTRRGEPLSPAARLFTQIPFD
jgi:DNA-binding transcriptional LysR family regulator